MTDPKALTRDELQDLQQELEYELVAMIADRINQFRHRTGLDISAVNVGFIQHATLASTRYEYLVASVSCELAT